MKIWMVDAFTNQAYSGNPAAVTIVKEFPSNEQCQQIAAEINLSETAFVKPLIGQKFHIRWFTPAVEVKLCGHATLASAHILFQEKIVEDGLIQFESLSGPLNVCRSIDGLTLDFPLQQTKAALDTKLFENIFNTKVIAAETAVDDLIIEFSDENVLRQLIVDPKKIAEIDYRAIILTAKSVGKYDFVSRFFAPKIGINEDPVTGSAHCKLAYYWQKKLNKNKFLAFQASKRGGELQLEIIDKRVHLTGNAVTVLSGNWLIKPSF